jgi:hypothetical protein
MTRLFFGLAALFLLASPLQAADPVMTAEQKAQTDYAIRRGQQIFILDQAAWVASDAMYEALPKRDQLRIKGWIVDLDGDDLMVRFFGMSRGKPHWIYVARVRAGAVVAASKASDAERANITPVQRRMINAVEIARQTAKKQKFLICAREIFNTVVIPPANASEPVEVYLLTPQTQADVYRFGGHHKVVVSADGGVTSRPFTKACVNLPTVDGDAKAIVLGVNHFLDPTPTEIHVFTVLTVRTSLVVVTKDDDVWAVGSREIRYDGQRTPSEDVAPKAQ